MNSEVKTLWVDALRSNDYAQGHGFLRTENSLGEPMFCCLGVLCDLYLKAHPKELGWQGRASTFEFFDSRYTLPKQVREWSGLDSRDPILFPSIGFTASRANDSGRTFAEIAAAIEETL